MTLGSPLLLSGDRARPLSRIRVARNGAENFQECLLQELIDEQTERPAGFRATSRYHWSCIAGPRSAC